jgi:hypothetical protein
MQDSTRTTASSVRTVPSPKAGNEGMALGTKQSTGIPRTYGLRNKAVRSGHVVTSVVTESFSKQAIRVTDWKSTGPVVQWIERRFPKSQRVISELLRSFARRCLPMTCGDVSFAGGSIKLRGFAEKSGWIV